VTTELGITAVPRPLQYVVGQPFFAPAFFYDMHSGYTMYACPLPVQDAA
jgi:hypothetical protein